MSDLPPLLEAQTLVGLNKCGPADPSAYCRGIRMVVFGLLTVLVLGGCGSSSVSLDEDPSEYREEERRLERHISDNPKDGEALRDLGVIYMRTGRSTQAYDTLKKAFSHLPEDPQTLFFLGLASEKVGRTQAALKLFRRYDEVPADSKYRELMEGRHEWLVREEARQNVRELMAQERQTGDQTVEDVSPRTVAIMPFEYQGGEDRYAPLSRGLAEMMSTDLSHVNRLRVVERVRLQAILDELELAQSEYVNPETAPRVGRLLGAGRLVGGTYLVNDDGELRMHVSLADVTTGGQEPQLEDRQGSITELFELQKQVTFAVVDRIGVELTPQERAAIEEVPTENLQAFLAYSRGLLEEDRGNYGVAAEHYREAQQLDPNFEAAAEGERKSRGLNAAAGSQEAALAQAPEEDVPEPESTVDPVEERLTSMGANPTPDLDGDEEEGGDDTRDPAQEATSADESVLEDPPAPPSETDGGT